MKQIRVVLQQAEPPPSLLAASRARSGYGLVGAAPRPPGDDDEPSLDARILAIAAPSLLALALDPVLAAVDVAFVGRCGAGRSGAAPLAAVAASTGFFGFVFSATNSFTSAGTPLVAKARADDGDAAALRLGGAVVRAAAVVGVGLMLASEAAAPAAMRVFAPDGVESASVAFTRLRAASAPAVVGAAALNGALRGVGDARAALDAAALAAVVNVSLDALLVWRLGLNPNGAAAATAVAEWAALAFLAARFARRVGDAGAAAAPDGVFAGLETFTHAAAATQSIRWPPAMPSSSPKSTRPPIAGARRFASSPRSLALRATNAGAAKAARSRAASAGHSLLFGYIQSVAKVGA